jgi:tetratricopeptide (TPR) repeat protein
VADYSEAIRLNPADATTYNNRGFTYYRQEQYEAAVVDYSEAIRLNTAYAEAFYNWGLAYSIQGQYEAAVADYSEAIRLNPPTPRPITIGPRLFRAGTVRGGGGGLQRSNSAQSDLHHGL